MAYVSLERFRYINKIQKMFGDAKKEIDEMPIPIDAISIRISNRFDEFTKCHCCKIFGRGERTGWDVKIVGVFLFIQFICLSFVSYHNNYDNLFFTIFLLSFIGILTPFIFIVIGAAYVQFYRNKVNTILNDSRQYNEGYKAKIGKMEQQVGA